MMNLPFFICLLATGLGLGSTGPAVTNAFVDSNGSVHIITADGHQQQIDPEKWQSGGEFSDLKVAEDGKTVGWVANQMLSPLQGGANYEYAVGLEVDVWRDGKVIRKVSPDAFVIRSWIFLKNGEEMAIHAAPPHGQDLYECTRFGVRSGKILAHWSLDRRDYVVPEWAKPLLVNDPLPGPEEILNWIPQSQKAKTKASSTPK
ncbi:MAG: hypothetical protein JST28_01830 [Acidobacteria bacterium]|nr:hypothetical protein [Acidobacteriota bacterium]